MVCTIRKWNLNDAKELAEAISNKKVQDNLRDGLPYPYTEQDGQEFIREMLAADENTTFAFAIIYDSKVIGSIGVFRQSNIHYRTAELGYYIAEEYWGKGIMTDAVKQVCSYVFSNSDIIRIYAEPFSHNIGSCRVLEKAGFTFEGTLCRNAVKNGKVIDMKMYALTDERIEKQDPDDWERLYAAAKNVISPREISPFIEAGGVGAAIMSKAGNIYTGVCIDTACTLGMCAERNAIANMITNGESRIAKVVAIGPDGKAGSPCGACREYMMQLDKNSGDIEILLDFETRKTITLKELLPNWWGTSRF